MKKITYEIKLEKSVKIILGALAIGLLLNVFSSPITQEIFGIKSANAELFHNKVLRVFITNMPLR